MRGFLLFLSTVGLVTGCGCSETGIEGHPDAFDVVSPDTVTDVSTEPGIDTMSDPEPEPLEDAEEEELLPADNCGNGILEEGEECDDGDTDDCNGCSASCTWERAMFIERGIIGAIIEETTAPCIPTPYTIEMWFKLDPGIMGTDCALHSGPNCLYSRIGYTSEIRSIFQVHNCSAGIDGRLPESFSRDTWHHFATTYSVDPSEGRASLQLFLDGREDGGLGCWPPLPIPCGEPIKIASCYMTIDEFRISSAVLYTRDVPFTPERRLRIGPDTVALWDFNQEIDGVIPDTSGNGHDAVLVNGTLVPDECHLP